VAVDFRGRSRSRTDQQRQRTRAAPRCDLAKTFGTQSESGSRFVETMLTVVETCRQQSRPVFEFITTTLQAHFAGTNAPTLTGV
jgi:hypothetical protein